MVAPLPAHYAATKDRARHGARLVLRGIWINAGLAMLKIGGGIWGRSYALIADGVESLLDIGSSTLVWLGFQWAAQPPDDDHPYGHGKADSLVALLTGIIVIGAGVAVGWTAVSDIRTPGPVPRWETLVILAVVIATKFWFSKKLGHEHAGTRSVALGAEAWHHFADAISSAAAFIGISIAVIGGPACVAADGWAALIASVVIMTNGVRILPEALNEAMDRAVPESMDRRIREIAIGVQGVEELDKTRVRKSGLSYLVDIQIRVKGDLTVTAGHDIAHAVKDALITSELGVTDVSVHVEPVK